MNSHPFSKEDTEETAPTTPSGDGLRKNQAIHMKMRYSKENVERASTTRVPDPVLNLPFKNQEFELRSTQIKIGKEPEHPASRILFQDPHVAWIVYFKNGKYVNVIQDSDGKLIVPVVVSAYAPWDNDNETKRDKKISDAFVMSNWKKSDATLVLTSIKTAYYNNPTFKSHLIGPQLAEVQASGKNKEDKMSRHAWADFVEKELSIIVDENKQFYVYDHGVYSIDNKNKKISNFYRDTHGDGFNDAILVSVLNQLSFMRDVDHFKFNPDRNITNFKNGLLNLKTGKMSDHTPQYITTIQIPHDYIPNSRSEAIDVIILDILKPEDIKALKEFIGYCMTLKINFKTAIMLIGDRHSGKSTLEKIIHAVIGRFNISKETLQSLSGKFNMFSLKNKLLNMADELPSKTIYDNAPFKTITGGTEFVRGEEKKIQSGIFRQTSKLLFSANKVPESFDKEDEAYLVRWNLISCDNYFDPNDTKKTNKNILDHLTEEDYAQFGSECIELFMDVIKKDKFTGDKSEDEKIRDYLIASNHVSEFANILEMSDENIVKTDFYEKVYLPWCKFHDIKPKPNNKFFEAFKKLGYYKDGRPKIDNVSQPAVIYDVKVADGWDILLEVSKSLNTKDNEVEIKMNMKLRKSEEAE